MDYAFDFVITRRDVSDAIEVGRTLDTRMRRSARIGLAALGMMWLAGGVWMLASPDPGSPPALALLSVLIGALVTWFFTVKPILLTLQLRANAPPEQALVAQFDAAGIHVTARGIGHFDRTWDEVVLVVPARKGIAFQFKRRPNHWLPARAFASPAQRIQFVEFVKEKTDRVRNWRDRRDLSADSPSKDGTSG